MALRSVCNNLVLAISTATTTPGPGAAAPWEAFCDRFVAADGRVVDTGNGGISHSEGQGFAMVLATHHGDRATFLRLWGWAAVNLRTRGDRLFAWKWTPEGGVVDANNASDGDILIAWALLRAARRWPEAAPMRVEALAIAQDLLAKLYRKKGDHAYLLPGVVGFEKPEGDVVNPSYCVFPAFDALGEASGRAEWRQLATSGLALVKAARFGRHHLPPDWLQLADPLRPAPGFPARFGYDAVRVPLYLMWGARPAPLLAPFQALWRDVPPAGWPAWFALDDKSVAPYAGGSGFQAIASATLAYPGLPASLPTPGAQDDYYESSLALLTHAAVAERRRPPVPRSPGV